jgi:pectate lyase
MHTSGKRIVVFRVSGVINLVNTVRLEPASLSYVTVAGQTSPGGVTITCNNGTPVGTGYTATRWHDGIFRFLRFRVVRNTGGNGGDHSFGFYQAQNFIIDHCDFSGGDDECVDFMYSGHFSFQWSTVANSGPGGQRYGLLMNGTKHPEFPQSHISIHHCLFANHNKRGPEIHWGYEATTVPDSGKFDYRCNVVYNILQYGVYVSVVPSILTMNIVGNYFRHSHKIDEYWPPCNIQTGTHVFIKDNYWDSPGKTSSTAIRITSRDDPDTILHTQYMKPTIVQNEWNFAPVTTTPAHESYDTVLARVGAWPRDSMNKRTVRDVIDNVGEIGDCSEPYITSGPAPPADRPCTACRYR